MSRDVMPVLSEADRDWHEAIVDAAQILDEVLDLRPVDWDEDQYEYAEGPR